MKINSDGINMTFFGISGFEQHYCDNLACFKIGTVSRVTDKFYESSGTYRLVPVMGLTLEKVVKSLKDHMKTQIREGNQCKCLRRIFRIYNVQTYEIC